MPFHFCPRCGEKLQLGFNFCPSCGDKISFTSDDSGPLSAAASLFLSSPPGTETSTFKKTSPVKSTELEPTDIEVSPRPTRQRNRKSLLLDEGVKLNISDSLPSTGPSTPPKDHTVGKQISPQKQPAHKMKPNPEVDLPPPPTKKSPRPVRGKFKLSSPVVKYPEEGKMLSGKLDSTEGSPVIPSSPAGSPNSKSGRSKFKRPKLAPAVEVLQEGEEVIDKTDRKWKLVKLLSQSSTELVYEVSEPSSLALNHIIKLGAKDGNIFKEQNFLQRAAKPATVEKWLKMNKMDFLGIPSCVGFGLHADSYRFLIFPNMGRSLYTVMKEENAFLSRKEVLQLACKILDVLQYVHSNEYVHADINAENIYIKPGEKSQVYLAGYGHAFRYCPGGQHVEYRVSSRTPHEGTMEFISLDAHRGAGPSRRSDLQSLGYCMLFWHTGTLPWIRLTQPEQVANLKQRHLDDVTGLIRHCFGKKKVPNAFHTYLTSVMALLYTEQPNYSALKAGLSL